MTDEVTKLFEKIFVKQVLMRLLLAVVYKYVSVVQIVIEFVTKTHIIILYAHRFMLMQFIVSYCLITQISFLIFVEDK